MYRVLSQFDAFHEFSGEQERALAHSIAVHTGIIPQIVTSFSEDEENVRALRFWLRDHDGVVVSRDLALRDYKNAKECVKHALRDALRTARLDHTGTPVNEAPVDPKPSVETAIVAGYEQALIDFGIDKAGDFNPEGWVDRSLDRARAMEKQRC